MSLEERWVYIKKSDRTRAEGMGVAFAATVFGVLMYRMGLELGAMLYLIWMIPIWLIVLRDIEKNHASRVQLRKEISNLKEKQEKINAYKKIRKDEDFTIVEVFGKDGQRRRIAVQLVEEERKDILLRTVPEVELFMDDSEKAQMFVHPILCVPKKKGK